MHRDLKPENIFLARDGRVKILDFGLATLHDSAPQASPSPDLSAETTRSLVAGTAGCMAPEQVRGEAVDRRADIFALGAVLYEMLAGQRPFGTPFETSQRPLFDLLGSPPEQKRHTVLEFGHALVLEAAAREILPWLDRYLGPVVQSSPAPTGIPAANSDR